MVAMDRDPLVGKHGNDTLATSEAEAQMRQPPGTLPPTPPPPQVYTENFLRLMRDLAVPAPDRLKGSSLVEVYVADAEGYARKASLFQASTKAPVVGRRPGQCCPLCLPFGSFCFQRWLTLNVEKNNNPGLRPHKELSGCSEKPPLVFLSAKACQQHFASVSREGSMAASQGTGFSNIPASWGREAFATSSPTSLLTSNTFIQVNPPPDIFPLHPVE